MGDLRRCDMRLCDDETVPISDRDRLGSLTARTRSRGGWLAVAAPLLGAAAAACSLAAVRWTTARAASASPSPPAVVNAGSIDRMAGTLRLGAIVRSRDLGNRVFVDDRHGFSLASVGQAQYPAASSDGGRTWRVSGPALHLNAAQAPLAVSEVGALNRHVYFAAGGGEVVDTTADGGAHWWRAFFAGGVLGVVVDGQRLLAIVQAAAEGGTGATTWVYASDNGGRHWSYEPAL